MDLAKFLSIVLKEPKSKKRTTHPEPTPPRPRKQFTDDMNLAEFISTCCGTENDDDGEEKKRAGSSSAAESSQEKQTNRA